MKLHQAAIALSLIAAGTAAMAVEATQWNPPAGELARPEVKAELARATANGELHARGEAYAGFAGTTPRSTMTRAEVQNELANARANGELEQRTEAYGGFPAPHSNVTGHAFAAHKQPARNASAGG